MKLPKPAKPSPDLADAVHRARFRLTNAEEKLTVAKEQARVARHQRKAAKQAARAAKKQARLAKERVARAETALARLEARLAQNPCPPVEAKTRKVAVKKAAAVKRRKSPVPANFLQPGIVLKVKKTAARPIRRPAKISLPVSPELETPVEVLPPAEHKPTPEIVKGVEEIFTEENVAPATQAPATETVALPESPATPSTNNAQETL
jgi:hypothetical protein